MGVWLQAFVLTLAVEVPLALVILRPAGRARIVAAAVTATTLSHPLLCFVLLRALPGPFVARVLVGETVVMILEAIVYAVGLRLRVGHALAASATLNAASYLFGLAFFDA